MSAHGLKIGVKTSKILRKHQECTTLVIFTKCLMWILHCLSVHLESIPCLRLYILLNNVGSTALFTDPQKSSKHKFQYKFESHSTIYTFKNYFITVFSAINFQFSANKQYPNTL